MPQPLSRIRSSGNVILNNSGDQPLRKNEKLARMAMEGIASWATVESFVLELYLELAGGNKSLAAEMFLTLESKAAKSGALQPLITQLPQRIREQYARIARRIKSSGAARDKLAHWVWGYVDDMPDALLLANPKVLVTLDIDDPTYHASFRSNVFVYRENDFAEIVRCNDRLAGLVSMFRLMVRAPLGDMQDRLFVKLTEKLEF